MAPAGPRGQVAQLKGRRPVNKVTAAQGVDSMDWRHRAACRDEDPELFFPVGTVGPARWQIAEAKSVCRGCTVASICLRWALETGQDAGVWGGMSEEDRRALKRRQQGGTGAAA